MILRALLFIFSICGSGFALAEPKTPNDYLKIFQSGSPVEQEKAAQSLEWAGISSPELFDLVEAKALESLPKSSDRITINYVAHLTKALAYSGNEKYRPTIEKIIAQAPHRKLRKHAMQALDKLPLHAQLNPLIAPQAWPVHTHPSYEQRIINMLASDNAELMRMAAKRIHFTQNYQPDFLTELNKAIERSYQQPLNRLELDATAWMCRALAGSRIAEYKPSIEKVASGAKEKKLAKYAKKYLSYYGS